MQQKENDTSNGIFQNSIASGQIANKPAEICDIYNHVLVT